MSIHRFRSLLRAQNGVSLIETLLCTSVVSLVAGVALPNFQNLSERASVSSAAAQLRTDIQLARTLAVSESRNVRISYQSAANGNCYVVHTGSAGSCKCTATGLAQCVGTAKAFRSQAFDASTFAMQSNVNSMTIDALKGTVSPTGTVKLSSKGGESIRVVINLMGRTRLCTPTTNVVTQPAC